MREQSCESCLYWLSQPVEEGGSEGICRRYPPTAHTWVSAARGSADSVTMAQFPPMDAGSWCGEWSAAGDADLPLALEQFVSETTTPPPPDAAVIGDPLADDESVIFVNAADDGVDPFEAILQSDDTELWDDVATLGEATAASGASPTDDVELDDVEIDDVEISERLAPDNAEAMPTGDTVSDDVSVPDEASPDAEPPAEPSAELFAGEADDAAVDGAAPDVEHSDDRNRTDIVMRVGDADDPGAADDAALVISPRPAGDPQGQHVIPDPAEWMKDYPDQSAGTSDHVLPRSSAHAATADDTTDAWPDWSEWLESHSGGELRLDRAADPAPVEDSLDDDPGTGPGPVPEPPPWLNEPTEPKLTGWARRIWR